MFEILKTDDLAAIDKLPPEAVMARAAPCQDEEPATIVRDQWSVCEMRTAALATSSLYRRFSGPDGFSVKARTLKAT